MCLIRPCERKPASEGEGWKIFWLSHDGGLFGQFRTASFPLTVNTWLTAEENWVHFKGTDKEYVSGWHILKKRPADLPDASRSRLVLRRVRYRDARLQGRDGCYPRYLTVVADGMLILPVPCEVLSEAEGGEGDS